MKKKIIFIIILALIVILSFVFFNKNKNSNDLKLYGNIEIRQVDVSFQVSGKIKEILKEEGDVVKKGDLVASIDDIDYKLSYEKSLAEIEKCRVIRADAESKYKRNLPLVGNGVSEQDLTTLLNSYEHAKANYNVAVANNKILQNELNYTKLYAPDDGIITVRAKEEGAIVSKGQTIYTITKTKPIWVRCYIEEKDLGNIKYNTKAQIITDSNKVYSGYIGYIAPNAEFTPKSVQTENLRTSLVYAIRVYIDNVDEYLKQGMPVTVKICESKF